MRESRVKCDAEGCVRYNGTTFSFFKERKADGAGGMENWDYTFDLCPDHASHLLQYLFTRYDQNALLTILKEFKIKTRVE